MERAATTASSLEVEQDSGSGPRCQDTILGGVDAQTRFETTSKQSNDPPLLRVNTLGSGEDIMKLMELMAHCTKLSALFWGTATARTTDDREMEITASIDGHVKTITEASLRKHLKLEDSDSITSLPNTEIFEQLSLMRVSKGYSEVDFPLFPSMITTPESSPSRITSSPSLSPQTYQSPLRDITRQDAEIPQSQFPTQTQVADEAAFTSVDVDAGGAATSNTGLEAGQGSGTIDEGSLQQNELMDLVTKLTDRVEVLENDMQQTKKVYSSALTKLILRVKKLEKTVETNKARRRARIVISEDKDAEEDSSKQGRKISEIDKDPTISLVQPEQDMEYDFDVSTAEGFNTASNLQLQTRQSERRNQSAACILNMVPTKKALVKRDTPEKLQQRSVKSIFIGYPKKTIGYYFYFLPENKIVIARYAELLEKNLISQEVSGRAVEHEEIQDEDTSPSKNTSEIPMEVEGFEPPQKEVISVRRSVWTHRAPERLCLNVEVEKHSLGELNEPTNYKAALLDPESNKWPDAMNAEMQFMKDNQVWHLVDLPPTAEYIATSEAKMDAVWIRKFISWLGIMGAKHYHRRYLLKVHTDDNLADPFTKALSKGKLTQHARSMGLRLASSFM
ncbi:hypothetical protein Tco_1022980 [Tanacetum coccineum]